MAAVWRDGRKRSIDSTMIVPGDVIELASGDRIPADVLFATWSSGFGAILHVEECSVGGDRHFQEGPVAGVG